MRFVEAYLLDFEAHPLGPLAERLGAARVGARVIAGGVFDTLPASLYLSSTISLIVVLPTYCTKSTGSLSLASIPTRLGL